MDLQTFLTNIAKFLNSTLFPFILTLGGLFFIWNAFRYFILEGSNSESQERARTLAMWGVLAFVFILSLWGIVNLFVNGLSFGPNSPITPDYIK